MPLNWCRFLDKFSSWLSPLPLLLCLSHWVEKWKRSSFQDRKMFTLLLLNVEKKEKAAYSLAIPFSPISLLREGGKGNTGQAQDNMYCNSDHTIEGCCNCCKWTVKLLLWSRRVAEWKVSEWGLPVVLSRGFIFIPFFHCVLDFPHPKSLQILWNSSYQSNVIFLLQIIDVSPDLKPCSSFSIPISLNICLAYRLNN